MIRLLLAVLSVCLFLPLAAVQAQDADDAPATDAITQLVQQASESGMTVIILDGNGNPVTTEEANRSL